jgi:hypothetical protein
MMRRIGFVAAFAFCVAAISGGSAGAATSRSAFLVIVEPTVSASSTGLTLETEFEGSFQRRRQDCERRRRIRDSIPHPRLAIRGMG